jgi:hypothetical protein
VGDQAQFFEDFGKDERRNGDFQQFEAGGKTVSAEILEFGNDSCLLEGGTHIGKTTGTTYLSTISEYCISACAGSRSIWENTG